MKQKIVIWVLMTCDKCRSKALKIAVSVPGVERAALTGEERDHVEVEGDCIDSVKLTRRLRKNMAHAVLVSVSEVKKPNPAPKPDPKPAPKPAPKQPELVRCVVAPPCYHACPPCHCCEVVDSNMYDPSCTIL
ncbi:hypothetical protein CDL12_22440 [Handroanthus impetiginosus]|uniref:HMA domain-containing protein n=1 Tax=Handroanthus impetiginosus TaxID=429701 RepID=A0A2G9GIA8_9LAMI|nr:hypothetical protein CDL12_22440 [Handroanthus impetiginosus]